MRCSHYPAGPRGSTFSRVLRTLAAQFTRHHIASDAGHIGSKQKSQPKWAGSFARLADNTTPALLRLCKRGERRRLHQCST
jgi:hypothetical protein